MGFDRLKFSKNWNSATDFPTLETSETQVRADMQLLHDESKNALNALMEALEKGGSDALVRFGSEEVRYIRMNDSGGLEVSSNGVNYSIVSTGSAGGAAPATHAAQHKTGGTDPIKPADIGAQPAVTGAATTITGSNLTANRALVSNSSGKVAVSAVTATELGYLDGVTSGIQNQLNGKAASGHTHTAAQVGALSNAGGMLSGSVRAQNTNANSLYFSLACADGGEARMSGGYNTAQIGAYNVLGSTDNYRCLQIRNALRAADANSAITYVDVKLVDGQTVTDTKIMLHTGNKSLITPADIGAVASGDVQYKIYDNLTDIGLTAGSETIESIFAAMPNFSVLRFVGTSSHNASIYPNTSPYGQVEFVKANATYGHVTFYADVASNSNRGVYELHYNGGTVYGWYKIATTDYAVNKAGDTMTGVLALVEGTTIGGHTPLHTGNVTAGTTDLTAGTSALATGAIYQVYE